ncbi:MAG: ACT domain-containing protein [Clostridia bacterium]|nr:ACT domain-containing protein [Clostridia bacterium]MEE1024210.1 ACT domain-containing protein [Acutalibacteraceae bacterium]
MRAVISVIGKDVVGILAKVTSECAKYNVNIIEITQSVLDDMFAMVMMSEVSLCNIPFAEFVDKMSTLGNEMGLSIHVMHEDIFNSMHRI